MSAAAAAQGNAEILGIDVVFPRNETYRNATEMPIVFALHNADLAFQFGYALGWEIVKADPGERPLAPKPVGIITQTGSSTAPVNAVNNIWYPAAMVPNHIDLAPGRYSMKWNYRTTTCTGQQVVSIRPGTEIANGTVVFTIGSNSVDVDLTECPVFQTQIAAQAAPQQCARIANREIEDPDPCRGQMSEDMATCVMANLTETDDGGACAKLVRVIEDEDDDEEETANTPTESSSPNNDDNDNGATLMVVSGCTIWALFGVIGGTLLL